MKPRSNQVRIIAGRWRGRKLAFPDEAGLRPTSDRIRETLFNWLAPLLPGASCLDLFAGSGALGFESASRGAAHVVMVERQPNVVQALRDNRQRLDAAAVDIVQDDAASFLSDTSEPFDIVFLDPPFDNPGVLETVIERLEQSGCVQPDARIYLELARNAALPAVPGQWTVVRSKAAGQVAYRLYRNGVAGSASLTAERVRAGDT